jgi:hypothetical protein
MVLQSNGTSFHGLCKSSRGEGIVFTQTCMVLQLQRTVIVLQSKGCGVTENGYGVTE